MTKKEFRIQRALGTLTIKYLPRVKRQRFLIIVLNGSFQLFIPYSVYRRIEIYNPERSKKDRQILKWIAKRFDRLVAEYEQTSF